MIEGQNVCRIAILCSFNLSLLPRRLARELGDLSVQAECYLAPFNQHYIVALEQGSALYEFEPDIVIFFIDAEDLLADVLAAPLDFDGPQLDRRVAEAFAELRHALTAVRQELPRAQILLHNFSLTSSPSTGVLDLNTPHSIGGAVANLNRYLLDLPASLNLTLLDYAGFVRRHGWEALCEPRLWYHGRMRLGAQGLDRLARLYAGYVFAMHGGTKKCLVCDLDNTLWGGVVGEVGASEIELSEDGIGRAYKDVQRELLGLKKLGVLLALNSKNNWNDVAQVFREHPDMILGLQDFSSVRVNWADKASNIKEIVAELNIGLDSIVFMDDSPFECDLVRHTLPEVTVVQLPSDPAFYPGLVRSLPWFQRMSLSEEDLRRVEMMAEEGKRHQLRERTGSYQEFLRSLEMVAEFSALSEASLTRAVQLTQKTNQFNLTTRRYTKPDLAALMVDGRYLALVVRLRDRFGDSGLVGFALVEMAGLLWRIDTFLLSCRVLGRGLETAMLSQIARVAQERSAQRLVGEFIPTGKNQPAAAFFSNHSFKPAGSDGLWELDLTASRLDSPPWIAIKGDLL